MAAFKSKLLISRAFSHPAVRWRAAQSRLLCSSPVPGEDKPRPSMLRHLTSKIKSTGPIPVAEYMREVLTNPVTGYYVKNNMLGPDGDFITSPEISQIFGELLGVWVLSEWMAAGRPKQLQLVELGPGKGSLASDILRVFSQLKSVLVGASVSVHLVEVSPVLSLIQAQTLTGTDGQTDTQTDGQTERQTDTQTERQTERQTDTQTDGQTDRGDEMVYRHGQTPEGLPVSWYRCLQDVPQGFSIFLAHEFFDALPIHKFQRTTKGWREVLVDIDPERPDQLRFVVAMSPTMASTAFVQSDERRSHIEVCAEGGVIVEQMSRRIIQDGGAALIADYGHDGTKTDTFRGFKGHALHEVLSSPGSADLTADVDFSFLRRAAGAEVSCLGPVTQRSFLKNMGIDSRMQVLLRNCTDESTRKQLMSSYDMLTNPAQMGERFHFFSLLHPSRLAKPSPPQGLKLEKKREPAPLPVAGFTELTFT